MTEKTILIEKIIDAGITHDARHFILNVRDSAGNEARLAMPMALLQQFATIGVELHARHKKMLLDALQSDGGTLKFPGDA